MEPEGITFFTDIGAVSSQTSFKRLRIQSQGIHSRSSRYLETGDDEQTRLRNKFQKARPLPDPEELPVNPEIYHSPLYPFPGLDRITEKTKLDKPRPLPSCGDSLIDFPQEESDEIDPRQLWRRASVAECGRRDFPDERDRPAFTDRRSKSIRVPSSSKGDFQPKRTKSIHSKFSTVYCEDEEIWVETFSVTDEGKMEYYFKELKTQKCHKEPPTGAMNVVYLEDVLAKERDNPSVVHNIQREMAVPSVVKTGRKRSKWTAFVQRCKSPRKLVNT